MKARSAGRIAFEQEQKRKGVAIAALSSAIVLLVLYLLVPLTPGWEKVQ